jgi:chromosome partitioning protein
MRTIAFLTQKGGAGKTTLAASLAAAAAAGGERVIALDLDPQASLTNWGRRRAAAQVAHKVPVEALELDRLPRLSAIIDGLAGAGFTLAIFDTPGTQGAAARYVAEAVDFCLLPARPTCLDVEATAATFRAAYMAKRKAAFVLNQCPPTYRSARASAAAKDLTSLGVLAETMLTARIDFQDAIAAGLGVTEYEPDGRAAQEIVDLWNWVRTQLAAVQQEATVHKQPAAPTALSERLAGIARSAAHLSAYATPTRD